MNLSKIFFSKPRGTDVSNSICNQDRATENGSMLDRTMRLAQEIESLQREVQDDKDDWR